MNMWSSSLQLDDENDLPYFSFHIPPPFQPSVSHYGQPGEKTILVNIYRNMGRRGNVPNCLVASRPSKNILISGFFCMSNKIPFLSCKVRVPIEALTSHALWLCKTPSANALNLRFHPIFKWHSCYYSVSTSIPTIWPSLSNIGFADYFADDPDTWINCYHKKNNK